MNTTIITAPCGRIEGLVEENCLVFKGIPYAKAPVGELRWKAPVKRAPFAEVYQALTFGNRCAQNDRKATLEDFYGKEFYYNDPEYSNSAVAEDGLYLNIWAPKEKADKLYPVAFYIHGGAWQGGCGHEKEFRTDAYAKKGVILVTINYRVNVFGFLSLEELQEEDPVACGNYGILDQIAALEWVKENIASFGGDPNNITIFGQSAGGMSVSTLLSTPYAKGKFEKAIIQSGGGYPNPMDRDISMEESIKRGHMVMEMAQVSTLAELRQLPMERLLEIAGEMMGMFMGSGKGIPFGSAQNGLFRTELFDETSAMGKQHNVPLMIGTTKDDIFVSPEEAAARESKLSKAAIGLSLIREENGQIPAYVYYFSRNLPGDDAGAFHSAELWYCFNTLHNCWRPLEEVDYKLAEDMVTYWTNFMKNGDPNGEGVAEWPLCTKENLFVRVLE